VRQAAINSATKRLEHPATCGYLDFGAAIQSNGELDFATLVIAGTARKVAERHPTVNAPAAIEPMTKYFVIMASALKSAAVACGHDANPGTKRTFANRMDPRLWAGLAISTDVRRLGDCRAQLILLLMREGCLEDPWLERLDFWQYLVWRRAPD
jgi:hypothetical protein